MSYGKDSTADHNVSFKVLVHSQTSPQRPPRGHKKMAVVERFKQESMYDLSSKKSGCCREVAVVERFKQESMYDLSSKKSGCCREVAVVERFKQESMYDLSAKKSGRFREMAVIRGSTVTKLRLNHNQVSLKLYTNAMGIIKQTPMSMFSAYLLVYLSLTKVFGAMHVTVKANVKICNK